MRNIPADDFRTFLYSMQIHSWITQGVHLKWKCVLCRGRNSRCTVTSQAAPSAVSSCTLRRCSLCILNWSRLATSDHLHDHISRPHFFQQYVNSVIEEHFWNKPRIIKLSVFAKCVNIWFRNSVVLHACSCLWRLKQSLDIDFYHMPSLSKTPHFPTQYKYTASDETRPLNVYSQSVLYRMIFLWRLCLPFGSRYLCSIVTENAACSAGFISSQLLILR